MINTNNHISGLLLQNLGIDVNKFDANFLTRTLQKRMSLNGCNNIEEYSSILEKDIKESYVLKESLQNGYSEFFRNSLTYAVLENIVLPSIIMQMKKNNRKEIRIWSAACASGHEAYSLAILMEEIKEVVGDKIKYRIFATDQDKSKINDAIKGQYSSSAVNNISGKILEKWFLKNGNFSVKPELKDHIDFSVFDLLSENFSCPPASIFGDFDIVLCANLLFYYKDEYRKLIVKKTSGSLSDKGYLVVGETERDILRKSGFKEIVPQSAIFKPLL